MTSEPALHGRGMAISVPGRVCLFGERQDDLGLAVITVAIDLRMRLTAEPRDDGEVVVRMPNVQNEWRVRVADEMDSDPAHQYLKAVIRILKQQGMRLDRGCDVTVESRIPVNFGLGSSSALAVGWMVTLLALHGRLAELSGSDVARLAHEAERVLDASAGAVDSYACALGGVLHMDCSGPVKASPVGRELDGLVVGHLPERADAGDPDDFAPRVRAAAEEMMGRMPGFSLRDTPADEVVPELEHLSEDQAGRLYAALADRDVCRQGRELLETDFVDDDRLGELIDRHHAMLRDYAGRSSPQIERLIEVAKDVGALGCKVNGARGSITAFAPGKQEKVVSAIEKAGGKAYAVSTSDGMQMMNDK